MLRRAFPVLRRVFLLPAALLLAACAGSSPTLPPVPTRAPGATAFPTGPVLAMAAKGIAYDRTQLEVPAGHTFTIRFRNDDPSSIPHDIDIRLETGSTVVQDKPTIDGGKEVVYEYQPLAAGTYTFVCSTHPVPAMTGKLTVR